MKIKRIEIGERLHREIKILAAQQQVTIKLWCEKALQNRVDSIFGFAVNDEKN